MRHDKSGQWSADIGHKLTRGKVQRVRFYFGHDEDQAKICHEQLTRLWKVVKNEYGNWEEWLLVGAREVAKGRRGEIGYIPAPYKFWPGPVSQMWNPFFRKWEETCHWTKKPYGRFLASQAWKDVRGAMTNASGEPLQNDWCYSARNRKVILQAYSTYLDSLFDEWFDFDETFGFDEMFDTGWEIHPNRYVYENGGKVRAGKQVERMEELWTFTEPV